MPGNMAEEQESKPEKRPRTWVALALLSIVLLSVFVRLYPLTSYALWGSDSGEYYTITQSIVEEGAPPEDYQGWGFAYPYFTGMELLSGSLHETTGLSVFFCLFVFIPVAASLVVIPIFLIAQEISGDHRISLIAAGIIATITPNVFATSHAMPGAIGDFFQLMALLAFIKVFKHYLPGKGKGQDRSSLPGKKELMAIIRPNYLLSFLLLSLALAMTHHLSLYFLVLGAFFILLLDASTGFHRGRFVAQGGLVLFLATVPILYWAFAFPAFRAKVMDETLVLGGDKVPFFLLFPVGILVFLVFLGLLYKNSRQFADTVCITTLRKVIVAYLARAGLLSKDNRFLTHRGTIPSFREMSMWLLVWVGLLAGLLSYIGIFGVPGTDLDVPDHIALLFASFVFIAGLAPLGTLVSKTMEKGYLVYAWFLGIILSFIINSILGSKVLLGYRHLQYLIEPIAIACGFGFVFLHDYAVAAYREFTDFRETKGSGALGEGVESFVNTAPLATRNRVSALFTVFAVLLVVGSIASAYPPKAVVSGFEEGTSYSEFESVLWLRESLNDDSKLVTDHRLSSISFGFGGHPASWDSYKEIYVSGNASETVAFMKENNLSFVLLTDTIKEGVALVQWENAQPMTPDAVAKFEEGPFFKLFANGECELYVRAA